MTAENPTVSFGIIARARIPELDRLVNDLIERSCVPGCEIVVAVESTEVSEPVERTDDRGARWIDIPAHRGFGYNRNRVLEAVTGEILVWADDDCVPEPGWLAGLLHALEDPSIDAAAGNVRIPRSSFVGDSISALGFPAGGTAGYQTMFVVRPDGTTDNLTTVNAAMRVAVIREVGGFDETMTWGGEDTELAHRLIEAGKRIAFVPTSIVVHPARTSFAEFVSWSYRRGRAKRQFARRVAIAGYVRRRLASYGRIIVAHLTDSKVLLIVPLLLVNLVLQEAGFVAETISPTKPPSEPQH